jgi:hypothetical protein
MKRTADRLFGDETTCGRCWAPGATRCRSPPGGGDGRQRPRRPRGFAVDRPRPAREDQCRAGAKDAPDHRGPRPRDRHARRRSRSSITSARKLARATGRRRRTRRAAAGAALASYISRKHYGATVRAFNISEGAGRVTRARRPEARGACRIAGRVRPRRLPERLRPSATVFVSVGMLEHVGVEHYPGCSVKLIRQLCSPPAGAGSSIRSAGIDPAGDECLDREAHLPRRVPATLAGRDDGRSSRAVDSERCSTSRTSACTTHRPLKHWLRTLPEPRTTGRIASMYDDTIRSRCGSLYLGGSEASFLTCATLAAVPGGRSPARRTTTVPMTRYHLYEGVGEL